MALLDKYKGKTFAEASKEIQKKYKDRFDPITERGRSSDMQKLKQAQEKVREQEQMKQMFEQKLTETVVNIAQQQVTQEQITPIENNNPSIPNMDQPIDNSASQSYNQNFAMGGNLNTSTGNNESKNKIEVNKNAIGGNAVGSNIDYKKNPKYYYGDIDPSKGYGVVKRLVPSYMFTTAAGISPEEQKANFEKQGKTDPYEKYRQQYIDQLSQNKLDNNIYDVREDGSVVLKKGNIMLGRNEETNYRYVNKDGKQIIQYDPVQKGYGGSLNSSKKYNLNNKKTFANGGNFSDLAPLAINLGQLLSARKPDDVRNQLGDYTLDTPDFQAPQQQYFERIDLSPIERAIQEQSATFSATNRNISGGNSGQFLANEQANRSNVMDAIAKARMGQQQSNLQVDQMNAAERARVEQILMQQELARQGTEQTNIGLGFQIEDINARNLGAYQTNKSNLMSQIAENLSARQKEQLLAEAVEQALGYGYTGQYGSNPNTSSDFLKNIFKTRKGK